jgi:hypothetical protein
VEVFFEVFQASTDDLLHAEDFCTEKVAGIVDPAFDLDETGFHVAVEVVEPLIVNQDADEHGEGGKAAVASAVTS